MTRALVWETPSYSFPLVIKKRSHPLILILNYKNYPTIKLIQTTFYHLVISPSSSPGPLAAFWTTRRGEPGSLPHRCTVALGLHSVHPFFQITIYCLSALTHVSIRSVPGTEDISSDGQLLTGSFTNGGFVGSNLLNPLC